MNFSGKNNFSDVLGTFLLACVVGPSSLAVVAVNVVFVTLDVYSLFEASLGAQYLPSKQMVNFIIYILALHGGQLVCNTIRFMLLCLLHEAATRVYLMIVIFKKRLSVTNIRIYQEIGTVTRSLFVVEKLLTAVALGAVFVLVLVGTCALVVFTKQNNVMLAIPALLIALFSMTVLQFMFLAGCSFYKWSTALLSKWKLEIYIFDGARPSKAYIRRVVKSLQVISVPAGSVGILDVDIKFNYLHNLLENTVNSVVMLNDLMF